MKDIPIIGSKAVKGPLVVDAESEDDYVMLNVEKSCWISVGNISVYLKKTHEGAIVELSARGCEDYKSFSECSMTYDEAQDAIEECGYE